MSQTGQFAIRTEKTPDTVTIFLEGELDLSKVPELRRTIDPIAADPQRSLVLNLQELTYIDSTGIGVIVSVLKARDALKAPFAVEAVPRKIQRLFDLTGITPFLRIQHSTTING